MVEEILESLQFILEIIKSTIIFNDMAFLKASQIKSRLRQLVSIFGILHITQILNKFSTVHENIRCSLGFDLNEKLFLL